MARQFNSIDVVAGSPAKEFDVAPVDRDRGSDAEIVIFVSNPSEDDVAVPAGESGRVSLVNEGETAHSALYVDPGESQGFGGYNWTETEAPVRLLSLDTGGRTCRVTILAEGTP